MERRIGKRFSLAGSACLLAGLAVAASGSARAQSLDAVVTSLLSSNCAGLQTSGEQPGATGELDENLAVICSSPGQTGSSTGGGAASVQSSTASVQNALIQERLRRARKDQDKEGTLSTSLFRLGRPASLRYGMVRSGELLAPAATADEGSSLADRRFGLVGSVVYESLDRDLTVLEDQYDSSIMGATIVGDYRFTETFVGGLAVTYTDQDGDFGGGGDFETKTVDAAAYASFLPSATTFLQLVGGYRQQDFDVSRFASYSTGIDTFSGLVSSSTEASVISGGALFGYDRPAGKYTYGPRLGVNYSRSTIDGFVETGGTGLELRTPEQTVDSLQSVVGLYGSVALSSSSGVFVPQLSVEYIHEFEDDDRFVTAQFAEDLRGPDATTFAYQVNTPDPDFFTAELGVAAVFRNGIQPYFNLRAMFGNSVFDNVAATLGVRF